MDREGAGLDSRDPAALAEDGSASGNEGMDHRVAKERVAIVRQKLLPPAGLVLPKRW